MPEAPAHPSRAPRWLFYALLVGVAARLTLVWSGACDRCVIVDDAYYGFGIARRLALGQGSTFDGVNPTNGYHPLFVWLAAPLYWAFPRDPWAPIHWSLTFYAALDACTAVLLWLILARLGLRRGAAAAAGLWLFWPSVFLITLDGCEAALAACLAAWVLWLGLEPRASLRRRALAGAAAGLAFLARTDFALLLLVYWLCRLAAARRAGRLRREARGWALAELPAAAAVAAPWLAWNAIRFHSIVQTSGIVKRRLYTSIGALPHAPAAGMWRWVLHNPYLLIRKALAVTVGEEFRPHPIVSHAAAAALLLLTLAAAAATIRAARRGDAPAQAFAAAFGWGAAWLPLYLGVYAYYLHYYFQWYFAVPLLAFILWLAAGAERLPRRAFAGAAAAALVLFALQLARFFALVPAGQYDDEDRLRPLFSIVNQLADDRTVVGSWNSGAYGYFAAYHARGVWVNLDGVVNNPLYRIIESGDYGDWLLKHVHIIVEMPSSASPFLPPKRFREVFSQFRPVSLEPFVAVNLRLMPQAAARSSP